MAKAIFWLIAAVFWVMCATVILLVAGVLALFPQTRGKARSVLHALNWSGKSRRQYEEKKRHEAFEREYNSLDAVAVRADHAYRARVTECRIDAIRGGEFVFAAEGRPDVRVQVKPDVAPRFTGLHKGDIVQATVTPDGTGVEKFTQLLRANGAEPREPVWFTG